MAMNLIGLALAYGIFVREVEHFNGYPHKLHKTFSYKANAEEYAKQLRSQGKKVKLVTKTTDNGRKFYVLYVRTANKKSPKKKK